MNCFPRALLVVLLASSITVGADLFDRQAASAVKQFIEKGKAVPEITIDESARLKPLSATLTTPCLLIKTDEGNYAKALVSWGLRKGPKKPTPVLLIERYVTYRQDRLDLTAATGKDVMLFPGFGFNFDIGQVVPKGQGEDIEFTEESALKSVGEAKIVAFDASQLPPTDTNKRHDPSDHEGVEPEDFTGTWKVDTDGRWTGEWQLKVNSAGRATGTFVSDESRNSYELSGQVAAVPNHLKLDVFLANTQMAVETYLWTKDKSKMAGTVTLSGRKFGFVATRVADAP